MPIMIITSMSFSNPQLSFCLANYIYKIQITIAATEDRNLILHFMMSNSTFSSLPSDRNKELCTTFVKLNC